VLESEGKRINTNSQILFPRFFDILTEREESSYSSTVSSVKKKGNPGESEAAHNFEKTVSRFNLGPHMGGAKVQHCRSLSGIRRGGPEGVPCGQSPGDLKNSEGGKSEINNEN